MTNTEKLGAAKARVEAARQRALEKLAEFRAVVEESPNDEANNKLAAMTATAIDIGLFGEVRKP